ncbi:MAG: hypothetical protein JXB62_05695 [Pirellulales bacterium]|nr:hypothetical protein [Pirellulales bacterium]
MQARQPQRPDLSQLSAKMAANQARVAQFVEHLDGSVDELVAAAGRQDWGDVQRLSGQIAEQGRASGFRAVSAMAQRVFDEAHRPNNALGIKQSLIRLIGTCGQTSTPHRRGGIRQHARP